MKSLTFWAWTNLVTGVIVVAMGMLSVMFGRDRIAIVLGCVNLYMAYTFIAKFFEYREAVNSLKRCMRNFEKVMFGCRASFTAPMFVLSSTTLNEAKAQYIGMMVGFAHEPRRFGLTKGK